MTGTAIELVRGIVATAHCFARQPIALKDLWRAYREAYRNEPFIRIVTEKQGIYRYPEPRSWPAATLPTLALLWTKRPAASSPFPPSTT